MTTELPTVRCPLLIGRDALLELADRRLGDAAARRGQFLLVSGEAGIGKSRFIDAVIQMARERGFRDVMGALAPQDRDVPAASILDLARTMLTSPAFAPAGQRLLALREASLDAAYARRRHLVMEAVDAIAGAIDGPMLVAFEDLQWADDLSLETIAELARRVRDRPILLCAGYRTDEAPTGASLRDWRSRLVTQRLAEEIRLRPLDAEETALVTTLVLGTGLPAPRDVAAAVHERTDGIPLHIEELLGALSADARANGYAIREATVPETIEDAVLSRLAHRSPAAQAVARAGAVIGRCFVPDVLAGIMDVAPEAVDAPLQELIDHGVLWPPGERGLYDFRHQLLRDAIYRSVPSSERQRFHARAGEFGARLEGQSEIHASLHYERAGLRRLAFESALVGARAASRLAAHREAFELYRRAIANLPGDVGPGERARIHDEAASEAASLEDLAATVEYAQVAEAAYREAGEPFQAMQVRLLVEVMWRREARPVAERLAALDALASDLRATLAALPADAVDASEVAAISGELALVRGMALTDAHRVVEARVALGEAAREAASAGDDVLAWQVVTKQAVLEVIDGRAPEGLIRLAEIAVEAERAGQAMDGVSAYRDAGLLAMLAMDYATAERMLDAGRRYADAIEQSHCAHVMAATSAMVDWAAGRWAEATSMAGQAVADRGCRRGTEIGRWALGYAAMGRGDAEVAGAALRDSHAFGLGSGSIDLILAPLWGLAENALHAGRSEEAIEACDDALRTAEPVGERALFVPFVVTGARAHLADGRSAEAAAWIDRCAARLAPAPEAVAGGPAGAALGHARGLVALTDGVLGTARAHLEAAVRGWDDVGRVWEATWARIDLAHCLARSNRFADAAGLAADAREVASRLESRPLASRADAVLRMARGRVAVEEPWRPLTSREFAVARLVGEGLTNGEIADRLGIAPKTASAHVEHILAKLGASRRAEIATWASRVEDAVRTH